MYMRQVPDTAPPAPKGVGYPRWRRGDGPFFAFHLGQEYMCICIRMHVFVYMWSPMYAHVCVCIRMSAYACTCMPRHTYVDASICMHSYAYGCMFIICKRICVHIHAYVCTYLDAFV